MRPFSGATRLLVLATTLLALSVPLGAWTRPSDPSHKLTVLIRGFHSNQGGVVVLLFRGAEGFPLHQAAAYQTRRVLISNRECPVVFDNLPQGRYAVVAYHDVNGNNQWDRQGVEGTTCSQLAVQPSGPPTYMEASFPLSAPRQGLQLTMWY
ncbi:DUF2141 domain-containing protein [Hymenobacter sp. BT175]|uniref:DUF2141 domain-containing protein n=1 Tax=Hymenobacter translucens TaxID=2886507 RepID=UPI001D0ED602|nr:DUF2141 domain-containing protein [Hymenobacter translucens]MCC2547650.1 DUF2141 domain-containing protein [Hymenobacter translucens]